MAELSDEFWEYCYREFGKPWDKLTDEQQRKAVDGYNGEIYRMSS